MRVDSCGVIIRINAQDGMKCQLQTTGTVSVLPVVGHQTSKLNAIEERCNVSMVLLLSIPSSTIVGKVMNHLFCT